MQGVLEKGERFLGPMLDGAVTSHVEVRQRIARVGDKGALQRFGGGFQGLGASSDISEVDPDAGIVGIPLRHLRKERSTSFSRFIRNRMSDLISVAAG